jgi:hypothetical protein
MSEFGGSLDPYDKEEITNLIPLRCIGCHFAHFIVELDLLRTDQDPLRTIQDIDERCSGYEGSNPTSEMYPGLFDRSGCPYALLLSEDSDRQAD